MNQGSGFGHRYQTCVKLIGCYAAAGILLAAKFKHPLKS
jgi:hypothetical protein